MSMEQAPTFGHEALFGPWRPLFEAERNGVNPDHIVTSGKIVKINMIPERIYGRKPGAPINPTK